MKRRTVGRLREHFRYEVSPLYAGGLYSCWRGKPFSEARHLRGNDATGNPVHHLISDFQDEWPGVIIFPSEAQDTIFHRFSNNLPDGLFEAAAFAMNGLLNFTREVGIADNMLIEETQALSFGLCMNIEWQDVLTRKVFDDDSVCLGIAGIAYEFLCVVASEFLRIFDQPVALLRRGASNVPDVLRLMKTT